MRVALILDLHVWSILDLHIWSICMVTLGIVISMKAALTKPVPVEVQDMLSHVLRMQLFRFLTFAALCEEATLLVGQRPAVLAMLVFLGDAIHFISCMQFGRIDHSSGSMAVRQGRPPAIGHPHEEIPHCINGHHIFHILIYAIYYFHTYTSIIYIHPQIMREALIAFEMHACIYWRRIPSKESA